MAEQSAFLTAFDEMQKKKLEQEGFNAPAPMESVVDTVGQAPAVQSPFSQAAEPNPMGAAVDPMAQPDALAAQTPPELTADSLGTVTFPGMKEQAIADEQADSDLREEQRRRLANTNAEIQINGGTIPQKGGAPEREDNGDWIGSGSVGKNLPDLFKSAVPYVKEGVGMMQSAGEGIAEFVTGKDVEVPSWIDLRKFDASAEAEATAAAAAPVAEVPAPAAPAAPAAPVMDGSQMPQAGEEGFKSAEKGSPQDYFLSNTNGGTTALSPEQITRGQDYAKQQGLNFDPTTGFSQGTEAPQVQAPQGLTTAGGQPLAEFLAGGQQKDAQGRMIDPNVDRSSFEQASADREARQAARPDFGEAVSDRDRRAARGEGISDSDLGDIAKANQRGASASDVARGEKVAALNGIDRKTGKPLEGSGLNFDQVMKLKDYDFKRDQESYRRSQDALVESGKAQGAFEQDEALLRQVSGDAGRIGKLTNEAIGLTTESGTTALSGSLLKHIPGTDANQLKEVLSVVTSKVALDRLMEIKKTGATLGQVSEKELELLQNSYDALKQNLSPERLREALVAYAGNLKTVEDKTSEAFVNKHGQEKFDAIMGGGTSGSKPRYKGDQNVGASPDSYYNPSK